MYNKIAVIGISFELPGIKSWKDFVNSLGSKKTFTKPLSSVRQNDIENRFGELDIATGGYLERIDLFDNVYFNFKEREALKMFPRHRLFLTYAIKAIYDAGYTEKHIKGTNMGVFYTTQNSTMYANFFDKQLDFFDVINGIEATKLAHYLDSRGPVLAVNTTCSSSLVAVHNACLSLNHNECNMALVGGVKLGTNTRGAVNRIVTISNQEECRPFDNKADGLVGGEGVVFFVLKRFEDAKRDNDKIYATIDGSAVNHGGARIASLSAPSSEAQKEVILKAWENAEVDPKEIRYIEAHGTGTILGDPIEFRGIQDAFKSRNLLSSSCSISSFKAQIGHLDIMSGMSGLLRLIVAINSRIIPCQANFASLNNHITDEHIIKIQTEQKTWKPQNEKRIGGVSSFGLTGTNVHMVVSQEDIGTKISEQEKYFLQLSESSYKRFNKLKQHLIGYLKVTESSDLGAFVHKVNRLFIPGQCKATLIFTNKNELVEKLKKIEPDNNIKYNRYLLLNLATLSYEVNDVKIILNENMLLQSICDKYIGKEFLIEDLFELGTGNTLFQFVFFKYLRAIINSKLDFFSKKADKNIVEMLMNNEVTPSEVINNSALIKESLNEFNFSAFEAYVSKKYKGEKIIILNFSQENSQIFDTQYPVFNADKLVKKRYDLYRIIIDSGGDPFPIKNKSCTLYDLDLPLFVERRFWPENNSLIKPIKDIRNLSTQHNNERVIPEYSIADIKNLVKKTWKVVLEIKGPVSDNDDFFDLGGDSISGLDMLSEIEKEIGKSYITYEEMHLVPTIETLTQVLFEKITNEKNETKIKSEGAKVGIFSKDRKRKYNDLLKSIEGKQEVDKVAIKKVIVTGGTGFLGAYIVKTLFENESWEIVCLIRGKDDKGAEERFWDNFYSKFRIRKNQRIKVVSGDIMTSNLMLSDNENLKEIDAVYHAAGSSKFVSKTSADNHINYLGTKNVFDWASKEKIKYFNYISTIGIIGFAMPDQVDAFYETDINLGQDTLNFISPSTKLMAEEYLRNVKTSTKINIYRITNVGGEYQSGNFYSNLSKNIMYLKLEGLYKLNSYSDEFLNSDFTVNITPVDMIINTICKLSSFSNHLLNTFHLKFEKGFNLSEILKAFKKNDIHFIKMENDAFLNHIERNEDLLALKLNKHESYNKKRRKHSFNLFSTATEKYLQKLNIDTTYDREAYLDVVIKKMLTDRLKNSELIFEK